MSAPFDPQQAPMAQLTADMERAQYLIPGYLKKSLPADDYQWMKQFLFLLQQQGKTNELARQLGDAFMQEIAWVQRIQDQLAFEARPFDMQSGWQSLKGRLESPSQPDAPEKPQQTGSKRLTSTANAIKSELTSWLDHVIAWWKKPVIGALASAMIVAQIGLLAAVVKHMRPDGTQITDVTPLSGAQSAQGAVVLSVVFKDSASLRDVRSLIDSVQGRVVGGPGALGVWAVAVPQEKLHDALKAFSAAQAVESASP